ncbi:hypothetical protein FIBSPDRAFT_966948 [Athelia psychrophila]|uniref:Uncharacterized protein n=1 Tax=Athelia psychrophila TaxID=1759441 RepID=A0A167W9A6_9AGAM|nr:hypothetical protein FIBSPDRAFT_966948 [Fibularhizoctonia sp. CBS 109695]
MHPPRSRAGPVRLSKYSTLPAKWEKTDEAQWSSAREEWATERERLSSTREEWKLKAKARQQGATSGFWLIGGGGSKRFHGGPATAPGPRSLSTDSDRPRHLRKRNTSSTRGRLRSSSREVRSMGAEYHDEESTDSEPGRTIWRRSSSSGRQSPRSTKPSWLTGADTDSIVDSEPSSYADCDTNKHHTDSDMHLTSTQAAVGVLVSNVATAVVLWRAKPEE